MTKRAPVALPHPLVDASGPGWVATFTEAALVGINSGRSALFTDAVGAGVRVVLVTKPTARLTYPLFQLLRSTGSLWLTRSGNGLLRDALSNTEVDEFGSAADSAAIISALSDQFGGTPKGSSTVAESVSSDVVGSTAWLQFAVSTHHAAREEATMGGTLDTLVEGIVGASPIAWGSAEPVGLPWDRATISGLARSRMPADTRVIVAGTGSATFRATIRIARSDIGITEETRVVFAVPDEVASATENTTRLLERLADRQQVLLGSAWSMRGAPDTTIAAGRELLPQPVAAVVGARGVRALGIDSVGIRLPGSRLAGNRRAPSLVIGFGGDGTAWRRFADTVASIGPDEIGGALFPDDLIAGGGNNAP